MDIPDYLRALQCDGQAIVQSLAEDPIVVNAPRLDDPDAGPDLGLDTDAQEAVELHRALTAWLKLHRRLHPCWHRSYRASDPGYPDQRPPRTGQTAR